MPTTKINTQDMNTKYLEQDSGPHDLIPVECTIGKSSSSGVLQSRRMGLAYGPTR